MTTHGEAGLTGLISDLAADLEDVEAAVDAGATEYRRGRHAFARCSPTVLEVRLPPDIADAALRTPDTSASPDGGGWTRFTPSTSEQHVVDRAEAWFLTAWRHAADR